MLWRAWQQLLQRRGIRFESPSLDEFNFCRTETIEDHVNGRYGLVINAAAYTDVDGCESEESLASVVNGTGVGRLADCCEKSGSKLIHYSTDYVFDGENREPYKPEQPRNPINAYGRTKALGEQLIEDSGCDYLIIRTSWLYSPWGNNFVRTIARLAAERDTLRVVDDQHGRPTSAEHLATASLQLVERGSSGIFHLTDGGECTWYDLAREIVARTGSDCQVEPCGSDEFPRPARRPAYSVLDLSESEALLGPMPNWRDNVRAVARALEA